MIKDGSANLFVRGVSGPEVHWCSTGHACNAFKSRRPKLIVLSHQKACPDLQIPKKLVEFLVQLMVAWNLPGSLLDVRHHVDDLAQGGVDGGDGVVRW